MRRELLAQVVAIFVLATAISLYSASAVFSQSPTTFEDRLEKIREKRQEILERQQERRQRLQAKRQDVREKIATRQAEARQRVVSRIKDVFSKILRRLEAALARLDKIAQRIATRIDKLKARGVDTSVAEAALLAAEAEGSAAAVAINNAQTEIDAIDPASATVRDAVHAARNAVRQAKQALKDYHEALVEAIKNLKAARDLREATGSAK